MNFEQLDQFEWMPLQGTGQVLMIDPSTGSSLLLLRESQCIRVHIPQHSVLLPRDHGWGNTRVSTPCHQLRLPTCDSLPRPKRSKMDLLEELHWAMDQAMGPSATQRRLDLQHLFWIAQQDRVSNGQSASALRSVVAHKNQYFWNFTTPRQRLPGGHTFRAMSAMLRDWHREHDQIRWIMPSEFAVVAPRVQTAHERLAWRTRLIDLLASYKADDATLEFYSRVHTSL